MSNWSKSDGARIQIVFDQPIVSDASGNESYFTITAKEYMYVPDGPIINSTKTIKSVTNLAGLNETIPLASSTMSNVVWDGNRLMLGRI